MVVIDADAHVIETDQTWEYFSEHEKKYKPITVTHAGTDGERRFWLIDGSARFRDGNVGRNTPQGSRELTDVEARLRHMDELEIDKQVIYPSMLTSLSDNPEVEAALFKSYNRWLADVCAQGEGRLHWIARLPLTTSQDAVDELRWAKAHGAVGIFLRSIEGDRMLPNPFFHPLYEEAEALNVPVCVHASIANPAVTKVLSQGRDQGNFMKFKLSVVGAFHSLVIDEIPEKFPRLRFGFVETSSQWVPYVLHDLFRRFEWKGWSVPKDLMREYRLYVACQTDDDLPYVLRYAGEDNIIMGTDYGHADTSTELEALHRLQAETEIEPRVAKKILDDNARALYGL
jgi:predicted TIM-barrel fold metal-dependent hydrolase